MDRFGRLDMALPPPMSQWICNRASFSLRDAIRVPGDFAFFNFPCEPASQKYQKTT
jgi:hypothetical protein